jgi:hypothetical protein
VSFLALHGAQGDKNLGRVIAQSAPWQNVMDLKVFHPTTLLASPAVSLQDFAAQLAMSFRAKPPAGPLG